jgi:hypothetical protein
MFEDTKGVIRSRNSTNDGQCNSQKNNTNGGRQYTTLLRMGTQFLLQYCYSCKETPMISHERGKYEIVMTKKKQHITGHL